MNFETIKIGDVVTVPSVKSPGETTIGYVRTINLDIGEINYNS